MIGQYVVRTLAELGRDSDRPSVVALTRQPARARRLFAEHLEAGRVRLLVQDVSAPIELDEQVQYVVHAASPANPVAYRVDPVGVIRANAAGTDNVLAARGAPWRGRLPALDDGGLRPAGDRPARRRAPAR